MPYIFACSGSGVLRRMEELPLALPPVHTQEKEKEFGGKDGSETTALGQMKKEETTLRQSNQQQQQQQQQTGLDVTFVQGHPRLENEQHQNNSDKDKIPDKEEVYDSSKCSDQGQHKDKGHDMGQEQGRVVDDFWNTQIHPGMEMMVQLKSDEEEEEEGEQKKEQEGKKKEQLKDEECEKLLVGNEVEAKNEASSSSSSSSSAPSSSSSSSSEGVFLPLRHSYSLTHLAVIDSYDFRSET